MTHVERLYRTPGATILFGVVLLTCISLGALAVAPTRVQADIVASGTSTSWSTSGAIFVFDDVSYDVFGMPVDFGTAAQSMTFSITAANNNVWSGTFTSQASGAIMAAGSGYFVCPGDCLAPSPPYIASLVGTLDVSGSAFSGLQADLTYSIDGTIDLAAGPPPVGTFGINAFQSATTPASAPGCSGTDCSVQVDVPPTTVLNGATGEQVSVSANLSFPAVTAAGDTTVIGLSNVAAALPSNFAFNDGVTFLDITTTATVDTSSAPITVCVDYGIAGTVVDPSMLRLLHAQSGTWVDVTTSLDTGTHTICGAVSGLSPFAVASELPPTTTSSSTSTTSSATTSTTFLGHTILGKSLLVKDPQPGVDPSLRRIVVMGKALASDDSLVGDPVVDGATLQVIAHGATGSVQTFTLPPGAALPRGTGWKALGNPPIGYLYTDAAGTNGPVKTAEIKKSKTGVLILRAVILGKLGQGLQPHIVVLPPNPGTDGGAIFTIGEGGSYCVSFGGPAGGQVTNNAGKLFKVTSTDSSPMTEAGCAVP